MKTEDKRLILPSVLIAAVLVCLLLLSTQIVTERGVCGEGLSWKLNAGGKLTVSGSGAIPDYDADGDNASPFYARSVVNAVLEDGVTAIGDQAFRGCLNLRSLTIPAGVGRIGDMAFVGCAKLGTIRLDKNNPYFVEEDGVLFNSDKTELVFYSPKRAAKEYTVPDSVVRIAPGAFYGCKKLQTLHLPQSVAEIGVLSFTECASLKTVVLPEGQPHFSFVDGALVCLDTQELLFYSPAAEAESHTVPASVKTVAPRAFYGCKKLKTLTLSEGVTAIGETAFGGCSALTGITLPDTLETIGDSAFRGCSSLQTVSLSKTNARYAFSDGMLTDKKTSTLVLCAAAREGDTCNVPEGTLGIAPNAFYGCKAIKIMHLPAGLASLSRDAFSGCSGLAQLRFAGTEEAWNALTKDVQTGLPAKTAVSFGA